MDSRTRRPARRALAMCCLLLAVGTMVPVDGSAAARATRLMLQSASKDANSQRLSDLAAVVDQFRTRLAQDPSNTQVRAKLDAAMTEYAALSLSMGGDQAAPVPTNPATPGAVEAPQGTIGVIPPSPTNCVSSTTTFTQGTPVAIPTGPAVVTSTLVVAGVGPVLWDLNVRTFMTHTFAADLDVTITSPVGTVVTLTTDNGAGNDNVFNGTVWDDDANPAGVVPYTTNDGLVTDNAYVNLTLASPLCPEEGLAAFAFEDPNGTWTITISDDLSGDGGSLDSWNLEVTTFPTAPMTAMTSVTQSTPVAIPTGPGVVTSTVVVAGAGTSLCDVNLITFMTHTFAADLDVTLTSPAGTVVTLTTDNGAGNDNVFNGTVWDDDANPSGVVPYVTNNGMATDNAYANLTLASPLAAEEPMGAFIGEDPNGTWTITISDDLSGDGGSLDSWTLNLTTCTCMAAPTCSLTCPADITMTATDLNGAVVTFAPTASNCINVVCNPPSGSTFPVGTTVVTCTGEDDVPAATRGTVVTTYSSGNIAVPIPVSGTSGSMTPQMITVADMGTVLDVDLRLRLDHTFDADLDITLTGPNSTVINVSDDNGGSGDNYGSGANDCSGTPTVFDDEAATGIASGTAPFAGSFIPEVGLSTFDTIPAAGTWTLNITDDLGGDSGTLGCWELVITRDIVVGGGGSSCQFNVNVTIPFDGCCVDDASGDIFRQVVASVPPTSPLYGYWEYEVAATSEIFAGIGNHVAYRPGLSIILDDNDDPAVFCHAAIDFPRNKCRVQVRDITTGRNFVLRDRNLNNNVCTAAPPPM